MTVLKIIGIILLVLVILLVILLNIPVRAKAAYLSRRFSLEVRYLFLKVFSLGDDKGGDEKDKDEGSSEKPDVPADEEPPQTPSGETSSAETSAEEAAPEETPTETEAVSTETSGQETSETVTKPEQDAQAAPQEDSQAEEETVTEKPSDGENEPAEEKKKEKKRKIHLADKIARLIDNIQRKTDAGLLALDLVWEPLKKFVGKIYFTGVDIDLVSCSEDAAQAAIVYGAMGVVYNVLGTLRSLTRVDIDSVRIDCLYDTPTEQSRYDAQMTVRLRPASLVNLVLAIGFKFLFHLKKYRPIIKEFLK